MKPWLKVALLALVLALLAGGVWRALSARKLQQEEVAKLATQNTQAVVQLSAADVVQVTTRELVTGVALSGAIKAVNTAMVKARVPGELQGLSVREGDAVKAGQIIARVDATEYNARVQQAQQQAQAAKAQVDIARRNFDNNRSLVQQGFISKTAVDSSTASLAAAEATYRAAQAGADVAAKSLQDTVLRAPISGLISQRLAQPGERVGVEARIVEIGHRQSDPDQPQHHGGQPRGADLSERGGCAWPASRPVCTGNSRHGSRAGAGRALECGAHRPTPALRATDQRQSSDAPKR